MMRNTPFSLAQRQEDDALAPRIAVVLPIFRHSVLLSEAVESVLEQEADFPLTIVLVNDGCPNPETHEVCRDYALSYPGKIIYLRKPNGGLSDARNHGIRHALARWPKVEAIYMLDADNRLRPHAMAKAMAALDRYHDAGWIYPNIDMFGLQWSGDYGGDYSLLVHTAMNICEAGSLIRREVFDAGVYFDTEFKSGFEDWDFFLTAAEAGFRGRNIPDFGFMYRKRAESMLADSERDAEAIRAQMRLKHKTLLSPGSLARLEQHESPRYAIHLTDRNQVMLTTDPDLGEDRCVSMVEYERMCWRAQSSNTQHFVPPIMITTQSGVLNQLRASKLLHGVLWRMEQRLTRTPMVSLELKPTKAERITCEEERIEGQRELVSAMLMVRPGIIDNILRDTSLNWVSGVAARPCHVPTMVLSISLQERFFDNNHQPYRAAAHDFVALCAKLRSSLEHRTLSLDWDWRRPDIPWRKRTHEIVRTPTRADAAYPRVTQSGDHIGFVLPLVEFGGVERVALNTAKAMKKAGWKPHLFVLDSNECQFSDEWHDTFESVTFLADENFATWGHAGAAYLGTDVPDWSRHGDQRNATAMLSWLDVVINFHGGAISGVMGRLKRFGIKTAISLHLNDLSPFKRQVGNTYLGLAFEHAYDLFLPCSTQLADWCHAMGVPEAKIIPMLNAPSFDLAPDAIPAPRQRAPGDPLRAIYLGRLDKQKGLERLISIVDITTSEHLPMEWRLIGKSVVGGDGPTLPRRISAMIEPPLTTPEQLADAMEWADVFILPSYFEGLPLTILEAMRSAVIPIATDAGAVTEVVSHWENGIVLTQEDTVSEALEALRKLCSDSAEVLRLATRAQQDMEGRDWNAAVRPVLDRLDAMFAKESG